jgi:hypothetical protein
MGLLRRCGVSRRIWSGGTMRAHAHSRS